MNNDKIFIKDLLIRAIIGINDWERIEKQDIILNITIFTNLKHSGRTDNINDTLNYHTLTKSIISFVEDSKHYLIETLATKLAKLIIDDFNVSRVIVRVEKPGALQYAKSVGVEIDRNSGDFNENS